MITADKGYDWDDRRHRLQAKDVRSIIKPRMFYPLFIANNASVNHRRGIPRDKKSLRGYITD